MIDSAHRLGAERWDDTPRRPIFTVPFDTGTISMLAVIYKQDDKVVLVKDLSDCELGDKTVSCCLTEAETALFSATPQVQIQLRVGIGNARLNSNILNVSVADVLKRGCWMRSRAVMINDF